MLWGVNVIPCRKHLWCSNRSNPVFGMENWHCLWFHHNTTTWHLPRWLQQLCVCHDNLTKTKKTQHAFVFVMTTGMTVKVQKLTQHQREWQPMQAKLAAMSMSIFYANRLSLKYVCGCNPPNSVRLELTGIFYPFQNRQHYHLHALESNE